MALRLEQGNYTLSGQLKTAFANKGFVEEIKPLQTWFLSATELCLVHGKTTEGLWRIESTVNGFDILDPNDGTDLRRAYVLEELEYIMQTRIRGFNPPQIVKVSTTWTYSFTDTTGRSFSGSDTKQVEALMKLLTSFLNSSTVASIQ